MMKADKYNVATEYSSPIVSQNIIQYRVRGLLILPRKGNNRVFFMNFYVTQS